MVSLTFVAAEGEGGHRGDKSPFPCVCIFTRVRIRVLTILMAVDDETDNVYNNNDYSGDNSDNVFNYNDYSGDNSDYVFTCEVSIMIIPI